MQYTTPEWNIIHFNLTDVLITSMTSPENEKDDFESEGVPLIL